MRKIHSKDFKFKVALEAVQGDLTIAQIVSKYQIAESLIHRWKKQLLDQGDKIFEANSQDNSVGLAEIEKLHAKIGKLTLEKDFLEFALLKRR